MEWFVPPIFSTPTNSLFKCGYYLKKSIKNVIDIKSEKKKEILKKEKNIKSLYKNQGVLKYVKKLINLLY